MKFITMMFLLVSFSAIAKSSLTGENMKEGCDPAEWTCDSACQERKAASCGLDSSSIRAAKAVGDGQTRAKFGTGATKKTSRQ